MIPGLICRTQTKDFLTHEPLQLAGQTATLAGQAFFFTADKALAGKVRLLPFAQFHLATGESIRAVNVSCGEVEHVRIFLIEEASPLVFAAALSAVVGLLVQEETKPHVLHIFDASDSLGAMLCKQYFHIPYIYSVFNVREEKRPVSDFTILGMPQPAGCAQLGQVYFSEQAAAASALWCIDENGGAVPNLWQNFFAGCTGTVITGVPAVDALYWSPFGHGSSTRQQRKAAFLSSRNLAAGNLAACSTDELSPGAVLSENTHVFPADKDPLQKRELLQAADFYISVDECINVRALLEAMAAGCIPIVSSRSLTAGFVTGEEANPDMATGYLYQAGEETWYDGLIGALDDLRSRPQWVDALRQRCVSLVQNQHSLPNAAELYYRTYRGFAPVKLPFVIHQQRQAQYNGGHDYV